ncbi:GDP-mannose 4,6-dehydratase [Rhizobium rhizogenes]|nr:GDP-mannose 4,6-dehydratase [Rhizobium rhizogenes]MQB33800.1 NAD-dependent epimerase/dehydratase family protein [Rhizobium rhizogenes]NTI43441.1 NAD-dependent epimerase/dehydratase family protein [Rhizobium rhizogenes]NTI82669.1 NAD-dependent epimerase/dehydratase family protein [Rhizobium rhizogenes]NTJ24851.1 NAD-dependent epimerase/dehydratase family protein [Rhizobium rhizogenes]QUE79811.1 GDP-mannose 4,6-dehydratase [Rhizobium rhizogenes]
MPREHRILITGASGFVGSWLLRELDKRRLEQGADLIVLTAGQGDVSDWKIDITDRDRVATLIRDCRPTAVVHLAAVSAPTTARREPARAWAVNFQGTMNLAEAVIKNSPEARFIFASSSEVYGQSFEVQAGMPVDENVVLKPTTTYGATKAAADILVGQLFHDGLRSVRFRPFNHTGPGQTESFVVPAFAKQIAQIKAGLVEPVIKVGNLSAYRDFLDVRDVVRAYAAAALAEGPELDGRVFNLASGKPVQIKAILEQLILSSGLDITVVTDPERVRPVEILRATGNARAAHEALDWMPATDLSTTIADVLNDWTHRV